VRTLPITLGEPTVLLPVMRTDLKWLQRLLELLIGHAVGQCSRTGSTVQADIELGRGFVAHRIAWTCAESPDQHHPMSTVFDVPLAHAIAHRLGGALRFDDGLGGEAPAAGVTERSVTAVFTIDD
jgi:hypothetical protein